MKGKIVMDEDVPLRDPNMLNLVAEVSTPGPPPPTSLLPPLPSAVSRESNFS